MEKEGRHFSHLFYIYLNPKVLKKYLGSQGINFQFFSVCSALICKPLKLRGSSKCTGNRLGGGMDVPDFS